MKRVLLSMVLVTCACAPRRDEDASPTAHSSQGYALLYADLTGDGIPDRLVGAPEASAPQAPRAGAVFVHPGRADGTFGEPTTVFGEVERDRFGAFIVALGDLDGGGAKDVAIAAPVADGSNLRGGAVYVYFGERPKTPVRIGCGEKDERFGEAIAAGDFDGDGKRELVVGARLSLDGAYQGGSIRIYGAGPAAPPTQVISSKVVRRQLGTALLAMDWNGDGIDDLVAAGAGESVDVWFGGKGFSPVADAPDVRIYAYPSTFDPSTAAHVASSFGATLADVGDLDGDGIHDLAIANPRRSKFDLYDNKGSVTIYRGARELPAKLYDDAKGADDKPYQLARILGHRNLDRFGESIVPLGDFDGGGKPDFLVGAPWSSAGKPTGGAVYLFAGERIAQAVNASFATRIFAGDVPGAATGRAVAWNDKRHHVTAGAPAQDQYTGAIVDFDVHTDGFEGAGGGDGGSHAGH